MPKRDPLDWETLEQELVAAGVDQADIEAGARRLLAETPIHPQGAGEPASRAPLPATLLPADDNT